MLFHLLTEKLNDYKGENIDDGTTVDNSGYYSYSITIYR